MNIANMIIAETIDEVGIAALDYFTWGHLFMGVLFFTLLSLLHVLFRYALNPAPDFLKDPLPIWLAFLITLIIGIVWEPFENFVLYAWGMKFENRQDSLLNASFDIIFVALAAFIYLIIWYLLIKPGEIRTAYITYLIYVIGLVLMVIFHFIGKAMIV
jgi:hypothetical protein